MRKIGWFPLALFCWAGLWLLVASYSVGAQDAPIVTPSSLSTQDSSQPTMPSWDSLEAASAELSQRANDLVPQVVDLNSQLGQLQSSLTDSTTLLAQSLAMRKLEAQAAQGAVRAALNRSLWWQRLGLVATGALGGYIIYTKAPGALYGAAVGALVDAGAEILGSIRIKL
jgi:hypothetical protein